MTQILQLRNARRALLLAVPFAVALLGGCGSKNDDAAAKAAASDPQKSAAMTQQGVTAEAANQQSKQADIARRAAQKTQ